MRPKNQWRGRENSRMATRPPGAVTRVISPRPRSVSVTLRSPNATAVIWKTLLVAEQSFRKLDAPELLAEVAAGATYVDGVRVKENAVKGKVPA